VLVDDGFLITRSVGLRALVGRDLVEAVVDGLALGQVGEEAPGHDLAAVGAGFVQPLVLVDGGIVPLEGAADQSAVVSALCPDPPRQKRGRR
jgi:hypothetical protein